MSARRPLEASRRDSSDDLDSPAETRELHSLPSLRFRAGSLFSRHPREVVSPPPTPDAASSAPTLGIFSRQARGATREARSSLLSSSRPRAQSEPSSPVFDSPQLPYAHQLPFMPSLDLDDGASPIDHPVFAASLTPRQRARLEHASLASQQRAAAREHAEEKRSSRHAEIKVAMAAFELLESRKRDMKHSSGSHARQSSGALDGLENVVKTVESKGVMSVFEEFEEQVRGRRAGSHTGSVHSRASLYGDGTEHQSQHGDLCHDGPHEIDGKKVLAGVGGAAAVLGFVGAGYELYEHEKHLKEARKARQRSTSPLRPP